MGMPYTYSDVPELEDASSDSEVDSEEEVHDLEPPFPTNIRHHPPPTYASLLCAYIRNREALRNLRDAMPGLDGGDAERR
jgi:hypothetical protein